MKLLIPLNLLQFPYISLVIPLVVFLALFAKSLATWNLDANNVDEPVAKLLEIFQPDVSIMSNVLPFTSTYFT